MSQGTADTMRIPARPDRAPHPAPRDGARPLRGLRVGAVRGVEVRLDWSLVLIFTLVAANLTVALEAARPERGWGTSVAVGLVGATVFFVSVLLHELAHAFVGRRFGVVIRRVTLFVFGGLASMESEPRSAKAEFWMAIAGPITSFVIGALALLGGVALGAPAAEAADPRTLMAQLPAGALLLIWLGTINVWLAIFNLIPGFPLDGGRVLRAILWKTTGSLQRATEWAAAVGRGFGLFLITVGLLMLFGVRVPVLGTGGFQGIWLMLIGWFLSNAASASLQHVVVREALGDVPVARLMRAGAIAVPPDMPVARFVDEVMLRREERCYPVGEGDRLLGIVCLADLRKAPRERWGETPIGAIMSPADALATVTPDAPAAEALVALNHRDVDQVPVVEHGRLRGMLRRADVLRWIEIQRST
jgi:Zn-dependent protease/CBS domain-containing protein